MIVALDSSSAGKIYNLAERKTPTLVKRIKDFGELMGWKGSVKIIPENKLPEHLQSGFNWNYHLHTNNKAIREELNYHDVIGYDESLKQTVDWHLKHPPAGIAEKFDYEAEDIESKNTL